MFQLSFKENRKKQILKCPVRKWESHLYGRAISSFSADFLFCRIWKKHWFTATKPVAFPKKDFDKRQKQNFGDQKTIPNSLCELYRMYKKVHNRCISKYPYERILLRCLPIAFTFSTNGTTFAIECDWKKDFSKPGVLSKEQVFSKQKTCIFSKSLKICRRMSIKWYCFLKKLFLP